MEHDWLAVWNMNFMTFHNYIGNVIIPTDFHSIFQRGRLNHQPVILKQDCNQRRRGHAAAESVAASGSQGIQGMGWSRWPDLVIHWGQFPKADTTWVSG